MENSEGFIKKYWKLILIIIAISFMPILFTQDAWLDVSFLNTGNIGDTIGGITAPFVGIISIILLYITFQEQIKINKKQSNDNDFTKILGIQNQILDLHNAFRFRYDTDQVNEGKGIFELVLLDNLIYNTSIPNALYGGILNNVRLIDNLLHQLLRLNFVSSLDNDIKKDFYDFAKVYAEPIIAFYNISERNAIRKWLFINEQENDDFYITVDDSGRPLSDEERRAIEEERNNPMVEQVRIETEFKNRLYADLESFNIN